MARDVVSESAKGKGGTIMKTFDEVAQDLFEKHHELYRLMATAHEADDRMNMLKKACAMALEALAMVNEHGYEFPPETAKKIHTALVVLRYVETHMQDE